MPPRVLAVCLALLSLTLAARPAGAQTGANVLVVSNEAVDGSVRIAQRYADRRGVPAGQVLRLKAGTTEEISRQDFDRLIQTPIVTWLAKHQAQDRILYIVLTKGMPLRISGTPGRNGTMASVDSELALVYRRMTGAFAGFNGSIENPLYLGAGTLDGAARFTHATHDIYLVTRLDGFTVQDALALIDRATTPVREGKILLDQRVGQNDAPNDWLAAAAKALEAAGFGDRVTLDATSRLLDHEKNVLGYYSWGSNDPAQSSRRPDLQFVPGAIAGMFLSSDARTFLEPPPNWKPGTYRGAQLFFAGSPQSLTGDLIRAGVTGVSGQVAEPYLDSSIRPEILFPAYLAGFNLAEAFYMAMPALSWQTIVVGDPLCAPFARDSAPAPELDPAVDPETELPALFAARRLDASDLRSSVAGAKALVVRGQSRQARGDTKGARQAFEEAVALDDSMTDVWRVLASVYEELEDHDKADAVYRKVLERDPNDVVSLNNLAYSLAVRRGKPEEALPLAEKADMLAPRSAMIYDTLGWIKHLLGDDALAARFLIMSAQALPASVDVQLHAAVALAGAGRLDEAAQILKAAEALDPKVKDRPEYKDALKKIRP